MFQTTTVTVRYLKQFVLGNVCGKSCQGLTTRSSQADQQSVSPRLVHYATDSRKMFKGEPEQNQVHRFFAHLIEFFQVSFNGHAETAQIAYFPIMVTLGMRIGKVAVDQLP